MHKAMVRPVDMTPKDKTDDWNSCNVQIEFRIAETRSATAMCSHREMLNNSRAFTARIYIF